MLEKNTHWGWFLGMTIGSLNAFWCNYAIAQITPDNTLPNNSNVRLEGSTFDITGGTQAGNNLFHSFQQFSVRTGETAHFNNALDIQNIVSRVTGRSVSDINGLIRANGSANLFLLNPNGIIFGQNASLDVRGSFVATTANAIQFGDLGFFSATNPNAPSLLSINPSALLFNQIADQRVNSIESQAFLSVPTGRSLLLVGGNISPNAESSGKIVLSGGRLRAPGGRIEVGGLGEPGKVDINTAGSDLSLIFPTNIKRADVSVVNSSEIDVTSGNGGNIAIYAQTLDILDGSDICAGIGAQGACGSEASDFGFEGSQAGDITLNALDVITIDGQVSEVNNLVSSNTIGNGGNINISASSLFVSNGGIIATATFGQGNAGRVNISALDTVLLDASDSNSFIVSNVGPDAVGNSGGIDITTGVLDIKNGFQIQSITGGEGNSGKVTVLARDRVSLDGTNSRGFRSGIFANVNSRAQGSSGGIDLTISDGSLSVTNGGIINSSTFGQGNAGSVNISALDTVLLDAGDSRSFILNNVSSNAVGNSEGINITTGVLDVKNGSQIQSVTLGQGNSGKVTVLARDRVSFDGRVQERFPSAIFTDVEEGATGNSGGIDITTDSLFITNRAQITSTTSGVGNSGNINIQAQDQVYLLNSIIITEITEFGGVGTGGDININTGSLVLKNASALLADTEYQGDAGNIKIVARDSVILEGTGPSAGDINNIVPSQISTTVDRRVPNTTGNGGDISIITGSLSVRDEGFINATTYGRGNAGNIDVQATGLVSLDNSDITTSVARQAVGKGGDINITAESLFLTNNTNVGANSFGQGDAGNIGIATKDSIRIDRALITAETASGNGGNITLEPGKLLLLRRGSRISTTAGTAQQGGNGGNITINAPNGFVVSVRNENSDITANAFDGRGGEIRINSSDVFNFEQRDRKALERELGTTEPTELNPQRLQTNDITAFSQNNPTLEGQISINTPDVDQNLGLIELPSVLADASDVINTGCAAFAGEGSEFIITGRGGLPPSPDQPLSTDVVWSDTRLPATTAQQQTQEKPVAKLPSKAEMGKFVPARGWVFNGKGEVTLISHVNHTTESTSTSCPKP
jgi:filamentous hemagglutinin family protein